MIRKLLYSVNHHHCLAKAHHLPSTSVGLGQHQVNIICNKGDLHWGGQWGDALKLVDKLVHEACA